MEYSANAAAPVRALLNVNLEIRSGEAIGILGESGCGKTTLAHTLMRMLPSHASCSGDILFCDRSLLTISESQLREIRGRQMSIIPQDPALALNPVVTVGNQVAEVLRAHLNLSRQARAIRVLELLQEVGFQDAETIARAYPHQLSGGQRQRIAIARAVACRPQLVIADEPTSMLDAPLQAEIMTVLAQNRHEHGTAFIVITHDPALLAGFVDRIAVMYAGSIAEIGPAAQVFRSPLHPYTQGLMRLARSVAMTKVRRLPAIEGNAPELASMSQCCRFEPRCPDRMEKCRVSHPPQFIPKTEQQVSCFKYEDG